MFEKDNFDVLADELESWFSVETTNDGQTEK
jgi:hypothetical protein